MIFKEQVERLKNHEKEFQTIQKNQEETFNKDLAKFQAQINELQEKCLEISELKEPDESYEKEKIQLQSQIDDLKIKLKKEINDHQVTSWKS